MELIFTLSGHVALKEPDGNKDGNPTSASAPLCTSAVGREPTHPRLRT